MNYTYHIIIWGAGGTASEVLKHISDDVEVLGFLDNDPNIKCFYGLKALEKNQLREMEYDYIVICSIFYKEIYQQLVGIGVLSEKILMNPLPKAEQYRMYKANYFEKKWLNLLKSEKPEILISGISYHNDGINEQVFYKKMGKRAFNFANRAQDIFYDYQIVKLLDENMLLESTEYYIIGLCYYSFEYDFSKSVNGWEIIRYYPYIKEQHNLASAISFSAFVSTVKRYIEENKIYGDLFNKGYLYPVDGEQSKITAEMDFNKNYPVTVWENKEILKNFLALLEKKKIRPIIVIMPAVKEYVKECPNDFKQKFYHTLEECIEGIDVQVLDYFGKYYGDIEDYYHVTHFNKRGAAKFTERLVDDIFW